MTGPDERADHVGDGQGVSERELEARLEDVRAGGVTEEDLAEYRADLEASAVAVIEEVLPEIVEDVAERMAADPWTPAAAAGPAVVQTDYSSLIASAFDTNGGG